MSYQLTGKIKLINETRQISEKFKVREFVVTIDPDGNYPQHIQLQVTNDKCDSLNTFAVGSEVTAHFNLRGYESNKDGNTRYFNNLDVWRLEAANSAAQADGGAAPVIPENQQPVNVTPPAQDDDLPF